MPKGKTAGGLSFEVVDVGMFDSKPENEIGKDGDVFVTSQLIPSKTLARLELRRGVIITFILMIYNCILKNFQEVLMAIFL